jgi:NHL repeat
MSLSVRSSVGVVAAVTALMAFDNTPNSQPNPYKPGVQFGTLPEGRTWGSTSAVEVDSKDHIWVGERCGANSCAGKKDDSILEFDQSGKLLRHFGGGMIQFPHGFYIDKDDNIWVTDGQGRDGVGHQVFKFSPDGKLLMTLGKAGGPGDGPDSFNQPDDVVVAPNGDIFVSDGHSVGTGNARVLKFDKNGKFIKMWGKHGSGPGEFEMPHALAFDSQGRLFVGDRGNNRIQIFDQDGKFLMEWKQFGRPSGVYIDKHDVIYVADSESQPVQTPGRGGQGGGYGYNPGFKRGIRIGSAKTGDVTAFIPDPQTDSMEGARPVTSAAEGVVADSKGNVYGAEVGPRDVKKYTK